MFAGRYRLERKLGSGGMADVWLAEDQELGRRVAIKILHERYASDDQFVERFRREATHAAGLSHPNIVSIYDRGEADGSYFIVMEYVEGRTLKELIVTRGPCPIPVGDLVHAADPRRAPVRAPQRDHPPRHQAAQRDRRPRGPGQGRRLRHRAGGRQPDHRGGLDHRHRAVPLPRAGARRARRRELRSLLDAASSSTSSSPATVPFTGETPVEIAMKHLSQAPPAPSAERPEIPRDLDLVVLRALAKEPADRYRSAQEMDRDLELVARGEPVGDRDRGRRDDGPAGRRRACRRRQRSPPRRPWPGARSAATSATAPTTRRWPGAGPGGHGCWRSARRSARQSAGYFLYDNVRDRIDANEPIAVEHYTGILEGTAVDLIEADGFEAKVQPPPERDEPEGIVFEQEPEPGTTPAEDSIVTILVSTGKPKVTVPSSSASRATRGQELLTQRASTPSVGDVNSRAGGYGDRAESPPGTLRRLRARPCGSTSRTGPKPIAVPSVVGLDLRAPRPRSSRRPGSPSAGSTSRATSRRGRSSTRSRPGTRPRRRAPR